MDGLRKSAWTQQKSGAENVVGDTLHSRSFLTGECEWGGALLPNTPVPNSNQHPDASGQKRDLEESGNTVLTVWAEAWGLAQWQSACLGSANENNCAKYERALLPFVTRQPIVLCFGFCLHIALGLACTEQGFYH